MTRNATVLPRRRLLRITGGLAAPFIVPALAADRLVVNGYGAEFQEIITCTTIEPFEKKFGVKITYDDTGSGAGLSVYRAALEPDTSG